MTRIRFRQASDVPTIHEAFATTAEPAGYASSPSSFELRSTSGCGHPPLPVSGHRDLLGFLPFQRRHHPFETDRIPALPLPVRRFSQPFDRSSFVRNDLRVYSTPLALVGSGSSESDPPPIAGNHLADQLLRRYRPFMTSFPIPGGVPCACTAAAYLFSTMLARTRAPCRLATTGCHHGVRSTLEFCSWWRALRSSAGFTRHKRQHLS